MDEPNFINAEIETVDLADPPFDATMSDSWDEPLLADDLEAAYLRALEATEAVEREMQSDIAEHSELQSLTTSERSDDPSSNLPAPLMRSDDPAVVAVEVSQQDIPETHAPSQSPVDVAESPRVSERQVVEAALFVGGMPLTAKKLSSLFHTDHGFGFVECLIDELNRQYADEGRPYAITLGEGGYRMSLLPDFEPVRNKVFGYGPKDVKLTQDALEVLSLVAYKQPISKSQIETLGKANAGTPLRQLLQRELIRIDRAHVPTGSKSKNDPPYVTTPRFLSLFGIGNVRDLPIAEDIEFK